MVVQIKISKVLLRLLYRIDTILPDRYGVRRVPIDRYYTLNRAAKLLNISPSILFHKLTLSPHRHALFINKEVLVHPDSIKDFLRKQGQAYVRRALKTPINTFSA